MQKLLASALALLLLSACQRSAEPAPAAPPPPAAAATPAPPPAAPDTAAQVAALSAERERIEGIREKLPRQEISFDKARAQLRQKWNKLHAYRENGQVVRVKTYPHENISKRTEEFYFKDGALFLAFIEDEGAGTEGKDSDRKGKTYWFADGKLLKEQNDTGEAEASPPGDDAARLQQEAREYLEIIAAAPPPA